MSRPIASNLARSSPLSTVRREQVAIDPLEGGAPSGPSTPQQRNSPKGEPAVPFQRLLQPQEILENETKHFLLQCKKPPVNGDIISQDYEGLIALAQSFYWPKVLQLSGKLLFESENFPEHLLGSVTRLRFEAQYRMKLYDELATEISGLIAEETKKIESGGNNSGFNYDVIVSMRLLLNDVKLMTGRSEEAVEQLHNIKTWLSTEKPSNNVIFWMWQVKCHIVNGYIRLRNWKQASLELNCMINELHQRVNACTNADDRSSLIKAQILLLTRLSRMLFQVGSIKKGVLYFEKASSLAGSDVAVAKDSAVQTQLLLNQGLLHFASEQFEQALDIFTTVIDTEGAAASQRGSQQSGVDSLLALGGLQLSEGAGEGSVDRAIAASLSLHVLRTDSSDGGELATAVNNLAICSLYVKQIRKAINSLEQLIITDPARYLIDPVVFNLCTLYDLSYAPDASVTKKKLMQRVASEYHMDDPILHWRSFRL